MQDAFIGCFGQSFHHPQAKPLFAARDPIDPLVMEHPQVHEIHVRVVKDDDLAGFDARADLRGTDAVGGLGRFDQHEARQQTFR